MEEMAINKSFCCIIICDGHINDKLPKTKKSISVFIVVQV